MEAKLQLFALTRSGDVRAEDVLIEEDPSVPKHPRLGFARRFLQHIVSDNYPAIHIGDQFKENTLLFTFKILHVHITRADQYAGEKRVVVTGMLID
jgi:hypothetical protein